MEMAILTNYDCYTCTNNNQPEKSNLIQIRSDYDKKAECQTSIIERRNSSWKLHLLGIFLPWVITFSWKESNLDWQEGSRTLSTKEQKFPLNLGGYATYKACPQIFTSKIIWSRECLNFNLSLRKGLPSLC